MGAVADFMKDMVREELPGLSRLGIFGSAVKEDILSWEAEKAAYQDRREKAQGFTWRGENWEVSDHYFNYSVGFDEPNKKTNRYVLIGEAREIISGERERPEWMSDQLLDDTKAFLAQDGIDELIHDGKGTVMDQTRDYASRTAPVSHLEVQL